MAAQSGKNMLLKLDADGAGSFLTMARLRTRALALNAATVDRPTPRAPDGGGNCSLVAG